MKEIIGTIRLKETSDRDKPNKLDVGIIGAGVSGLSSALLLRKIGCNVTIYEKNRSIKKEGAGIQITSNGLFVLEQLELSELVTQSGLKPDNLCLFDEDEFRNICSLEILKRLKRRYGRPFITLHRSLLIKVLFEKVKAEKIKVRFGSKAHPLVVQDKQDVSISYKGEKIKKDLIVVADGIGSRWKKAIFKENEYRKITQIAYRFILNKKDLPPIFSQNNINLFFGKGRHFVTYPTDKNGMINFVFCKRERGHRVNDWKEKVTKQQFLDDFELNESLKICLPYVKTIYRWPVIESGMPAKIRSKNVVMVGDAALGMLPYMAQGANKALEDSWELANCVKENPLNLNEGLNRYSKKRMKRLFKLDRVSRFNEKVYHLERKVLRKVFLIVLGLITRLFPNFLFKRLDWIYNYKG